MSSQLSLVDAAGALRDAEAKYTRLDQELAALGARTVALEEELMKARREVGIAKEALYTAATADKVMIL